MTDPVEVIARAICRCYCPCITEERPCYDWEGSLPEARAALAALEAAGYTIIDGPPREAEPGEVMSDEEVRGADVAAYRGT